MSPVGWCARLRARARARLRGLLRAAARANGAPLSPDLARAVEATAPALTPERLGPRLRPLRPQLVLAFARQRADADRRLASDHWRSGSGHNVGLDVRAAEARARALLLEVAARRPPSRRPLRETLERLDALIETQRAGPGDVVGYGLATLHELRRDLAELDRQVSRRR